MCVLSLCVFVSICENWPCFMYTVHMNSDSSYGFPFYTCMVVFTFLVKKQLLEDNWYIISLNEIYVIIVTVNLRLVFIINVTFLNKHLKLNIYL